MSNIAVFHFDDDRESFEDFGKQNGNRKWAESDLMAFLDYQTKQSFRKTVTRAMQACLSLGIQTEDNFVLCDGLAMQLIPPPPFCCKPATPAALRCRTADFVAGWEFL